MSSIEDLISRREGNIERIKALIETFFKSGKHINFITDVSKDEIPDFARIELVDTTFKKEWGIDLGLMDLVTPIKELRVSTDRKGRGEGISVLSNAEIEEKTQNVLNKLTGRT